MQVPLPGDRVEVNNDDNVFHGIDGTVDRVTLDGWVVQFADGDEETFPANDLMVIASG